MKATNNQLPDGFRFRPATLADAAACTDLFNLCSVDQIGVPTFRLSQTVADWQMPGLNLADNMRLIQAPDGQVVGYIEVWDVDSPPVSLWVWGRVHPQCERMGLGTFLMKWAEARARQAIPRCPPEARVILRCSAFSGHQPSQALFLSRGLQLVRHFWRMQIDFNGPLPQPRWPENISLRSYRHDQDLEATVAAVIDAFRDHWGFVDRPEDEEREQWRHFIESEEDFDPDLWYLAMDGEEIAGICLCRPHDREAADIGYVSTLGVRRPWRRRGLGLAMLQYAFNEFRRRGQAGCSLGVDAGSLTGATGLYEKAGMKATRQSDTYELELRPGLDLSRRSL